MMQPYRLLLLYSTVYTPGWDVGAYPQHEFANVGTWENEVSFGVVDAALPGGDVGGPSSGESDVEGCGRGTVRPALTRRGC